MNRKFAAGSFGLSALGLSPFANAVLDVSSVTTAITDAGTAGATVGLAVLVMIVGIKLFKWVRRAL